MRWIAEPVSDKYDQYDIYVEVSCKYGHVIVTTKKDLAAEPVEW